MKPGLWKFIRAKIIKFRREKKMADNICGPSEPGIAGSELPSKQVERIEEYSINCPKCGQKGKPVEGQTVKAMLSVTLREIKNDAYRFCHVETCPVVYFAVQSNQVFTTSDLRERVYQKESHAEDVLVCYCFNHRVSAISNAYPDEQDAIIADIKAGIKDGQCACDLRNPQGSCCLGNVRKLIFMNNEKM
jgi:hypothetical protein